MIMKTPTRDQSWRAGRIVTAICEGRTSIDPQSRRSRYVVTRLMAVIGAYERARKPQAWNLQ